MRTAAIAAGALLIMGAAGCGSGGGETTGASATRSVATAPRGATATSRLPPGAVAPVDTAEEAAEGPAATEASPGQAPRGPEASGELPAADQSAVRATVGSYIRELDRHDTARVCALIATCHGSLPGTIGSSPANGGPAWRRSTLASVKVERLSDQRARVSATVVHHFSDRKYVSVEDDVIYLERAGDRWQLAQPSGTLYRAIGYAQPPLRAFEPPPGW